jgi:hypothetical protein
MGRAPGAIKDRVDHLVAAKLQKEQQARAARHEVVVSRAQRARESLESEREGGMAALARVKHRVERARDRLLVESDEALQRRAYEDVKVFSARAHAASLVLLVIQAEMDELIESYRMFLDAVSDDGTVVTQPAVLVVQSARPAKVLAA